MAIKKYINTSEVVGLTGCTTSEVQDLAKTGVLPAHKTRRGHWRFNVDAVENYFGIQVNKPAENTKNSEQEVQEEKLISGLTARKYLNCNKAEFESLVDQGLIESYRDENRRWKVSKDSVLKYAAQPHHSTGTHLITNENHYQEVIQRICAAKSSIKIMTANFKRFRLKPTDNQGENYEDGPLS